MIFKLAFQNIFRNRARTAITLAAIATGCVAVIIAGGFIEDSVHQLTEQYIHAFLGHVQVSRAGYHEKGLAEPFAFMIPDPDEVLRLVSSAPHVIRAAPRLDFAGLISRGDTSLPFAAQGVSPGPAAGAQEQSKYMEIESGQDLGPDDAYAVLVGTGLAQAVQAKAGDALVLLTTTEGGALNGVDVTVRGVFRTASKEYDDHTLRVPLKTAQKLLRTRGIHTITLYLDETRNTGEASRALEQIFKEKGLALEVRPWRAMPGADFIVKLVDFYNGLFLVFKLIILATVILGIFNTMNMAVLERIGEIGTMLALGTEKWELMAVFLAEGAILGLLGGVLGLCGGYGLARLLSHVGIVMPTAPGTTATWIARIAVVPRIFAFAFFLALCTALISSLFPAHKATRLEIADALRRNV